MHSDLSKVLKVHDIFLVRRLVRCFSTCVAGLDVSLRYRAACYEKADEPFDLSLQQGNYPIAASASLAVTRNSIVQRSRWSVNWCLSDSSDQRFIHSESTNAALPKGLQL